MSDIVKKTSKDGMITVEYANGLTANYPIEMVEDLKNVEGVDFNVDAEILAAFDKIVDSGPDSEDE